MTKARNISPKKHKTPVEMLISMLTTKRPHGSNSVWNFLDDYIAPLGGFTDDAGNHIIRIGKAPRVLYSSHLDTVHREGGFQQIAVKGDTISLAKNSLSNCLGADCTTGVWIMREMIQAKKSGLYVFHAGEECGGIGSEYIAKHSPEMMNGIDYAIAFDRKGFDSIITHQWGGRCASDAFAMSLASQLPDEYKPDDGGTFTDTANYTGLVGECSNISVGYLNQHTAKETQSISHALAVRDAMLKLDETKLIKSRMAGEQDDESYYWSSYPRSSRDYTPVNDDFSALVEFVKNHPFEVADYLEGFGIGLHDLRDAIETPFRN